MALDDCRYSHACRAARCSARFLVLASARVKNCSPPLRGAAMLYLDREHFAMFGPFFFYDRIARVRPSGGVDDFLQRRLVVGDRQGTGAAILQFLERGLKHGVDDEPVGGLKSCIEKQRRNESFQRIDQERILGAATTLFFTLCQSADTCRFPVAGPDESRRVRSRYERAAWKGRLRCTRESDGTIPG